MLDGIAASRRKALTPSAPWACAVTLRPMAWAADDGGEFVVGELLAEAGGGLDRTPPVAVILMMSAPARTRSRTARRQSSAPEQASGAGIGAMSRGMPLASPWPPWTLTAPADAMMRGRAMTPRAMASRRAKMDSVGRRDRRRW